MLFYKFKLKIGQQVISRKVYKAASMPCNTFPIIYGFIEILALDIMLYTCNKIESPPKPNKKLVNIMFIEIFLEVIVAIPITPFVNSKIPVKNEVAKLISDILNILNKGRNIIEIMFKILLFSNIESITLNKTINPPIITIVFIDAKMLFPNISPRFEKHTFWLLALE